MLLWQHAIYGAAGALLIAYFFGWIPALIFMLANFFIDFDHYMAYAVKKKDLHPVRAFDYFMGNLECELCFFHTIECYIALFLLGFVHVLAYFVLAGFLFHVLCDYIQGKDKIANVFVRYPSILMYPFFKRYEQMHSRGWINHNGRPNLHIANVISFHKLHLLGIRRE